MSKTKIILNRTIKNDKIHLYLQGKVTIYVIQKSKSELPCKVRVDFQCLLIGTFITIF